MVSSLAQAGAEVTVAMTGGATRFVTPLTFQALSGRPVYTDIWDHLETHDPQHVALGRSADAMLIAPCTMDFAARLATGRTDDVVSLIVSTIDRKRTPVLVAPSMNAVMLEQPATRRNLVQLAEDGFDVLDSDSGWQACRTEGAGRLPEPAALLAALETALTQRTSH